MTQRDTARPMTPALLKKFLKLAGDRLQGKWVLLGGAVLPAIGVQSRPTYDIDLSPVGEATTREQHELYRIAEKLGLTVEAVNLAASYFLKKVVGFERNLVVLHSGKSATFYRPDLKLFLVLKAAQMSEQDLADCLLIHKAEGLGLTAEEIRSLTATLKKTGSSLSSAARSRLERLIKTIQNRRKAIGSL